MAEKKKVIKRDLFKSAAELAQSIGDEKELPAPMENTPLLDAPPSAGENVTNEKKVVRSTSTLTYSGKAKKQDSKTSKKLKGVSRKKVVKVVKGKKLKTVTVVKTQTLEDIAKTAPVEERVVVEREYEFHTPKSQPKGGFIEMFGGLTMILIVVEAVIIIGLLIFIFFVK